MYICTVEREREAIPSYPPFRENQQKTDIYIYIYICIHALERGMDTTSYISIRERERYYMSILLERERERERDYTFISLIQRESTYLSLREEWALHLYILDVIHWNLTP